jgi:hypothetical protein
MIFTGENVRFRHYVTACIWLTLFAANGCRDKGDSPTAKHDLLQINMAYSTHFDVHKRAPGNLDELAPLIVGTIVLPESRKKLEEECLARLKAGTYVVLWHQEDAKHEYARKGTDLLIAYEAAAAEKGGLAVFADGRVERIEPAELERAIQRPKKAKQP